MKHIDNLFKEKLYNHEVTVPEGMWEKIAPIAEEESGRAILWFWFAGLLALLLGGYGIYKTVYSNAETPSDQGTLVYESQDAMTTPALDVDNSIIMESNSVSENIVSNGNIEDVQMAQNSQSTKLNKSITGKSSKTNIDSNTNAQSTPNYTLPDISNTVENITNVGGNPANLVITKSYTNKEGSVIKQSNLTEEFGNEGPVFDIIINSEVNKFNAGALLRIIEPLENIPLPAFEKELKKKTKNSIF